jgi:hypothetical protein
VTALNKKSLIAVFLLLLVTAAFSAVLGNAKAIVPGELNLPPGPRLRILSPENATYSTNSVTFTFTLWLPSRAAVAPGSYVYQAGWILKYYLDGQQIGQFTGSNTELNKTFAITLKGLSEGRHTVKLFGTAFWTPTYSYGPGETVVEDSFAVDTVSPKIQILSTQNKEYGTPNVPLNFSVSEAASWIGYSLDNEDNVTIPDSQPTIYFGQYRYSIVLAGLSEGSHTIEIYAKDNSGNTGKSETIKFNVTTQPTPTPTTSPIQTTSPSPSPTPSLEPSPSPHAPQGEDFTFAMVLGSVIAVAAIYVGVIFIRRRKR